MAISFRDLLKPSNVDDVEASQRRAQIAEAMQQRYMRPNLPEIGGPVQQKYGVGNALVDLANSLAASYSAKVANDNLSAAQAKRQGAVTDAVADLQNTQAPEESRRSVAQVMSQRLAGTPDGQLMNPISTSSPEAQRALAGAMGPKGTDMLAEAMLSSSMNTKPVVVPYGAELRDPKTGALIADNERNLSNGTTGVSAAMQWIAEYRKTHPDATPEQAMRAYTDATQRPLAPVVIDAGGVKYGAPRTPGGNVGAPKQLVSTGETAANAGAVAGTKKDATTAVTVAWDFPKAEARLNSHIASLDRLIKKADDLRRNPSLDRATGMWAYIPSIWGGKAADVDAAVGSLKAQLGFDTLQDMRANSPTGGALGNVSNQENELLQNALTALAQSQSADEYRRNLLEVMNFAEGSKARLRQAFEQTYPNGNPRAAGSGTPSGATPKKETAAERAKRMGL